VRGYVRAHSVDRLSRFAEFAQVAPGDADGLDVTWLQSLSARLALSFRRPVSDQHGQALIEYALIVSLIALVAIVALRTTGTNLSGILNKIAGEV
jgi:Flp pilus assembly pilin Flp